jgi:lysophospholipase L1-like esterase
MLVLASSAGLGCAKAPNTDQGDPMTGGGGGGATVTTGTGGATLATPDAGRVDARPDANDGGSSDGARDTGDGRASDGGGATDGGVTMTTIWLAGDSTVQTYAAGNTEGNGGTSLEGWGQELAPFFNSSVTVNNQAIGGRSVAFFMWAVQRDTDGGYRCVDDQGNPLYQLDAAGAHVDTSQWARIKAGIKPGDYLFIQFGTNDETHDCPRFVSIPDFESDLGIMADTVRAKGATPIFVTPMGHRAFTGTTVNNTLLPYANAMKTEATQKAVQVVDLNLRSVEYYQMVGNTTFLASSIFDTGTTHFVKAGAIEMAQLIVGEIRARGGALAGLLK